MVQPGDILTHAEMALAEGGKFLQKGMNFRPRGRTSVFLMSRRKNALYENHLDAQGQVLIYEGHNDHATDEGPDPEAIDQPLVRRDGKISDNGKFFRAAEAAKRGEPPEIIRVYEKLGINIWVFNGTFQLVDAWMQSDGRRKVCKFKLHLLPPPVVALRRVQGRQHSRVIPSTVKAEVWKRDEGKCVLCGAADNLHFDHELPFSKGGASILVENIRILCARHNLQKSDRIE